MIDLPHEMRDMLVEQLDEYMEALEEEMAAEEVASYMVDLLQEAAQECEVEQADDIVGLLESSGDLEATLAEMLTEHLENQDLDLVSPEEIVAVVEKLCEIEWGSDEDEMFGVDELDDELGFDENDEY